MINIYHKEKKVDYNEVLKEKYKAKADEKMKFTKENVEAVINDYFRQADLEPCGDLIAEIHNLDDTLEKVVVPKFVAEWIEDCKSRGLGLSDLLNYWTSSVIPTEVIDFIEYDFTKIGCGHKEQELLAKAWLEGYEVEKEQLYQIELPAFNFCNEDNIYVSHVMYFGKNTETKASGHYVVRPRWGNVQTLFTEAEIKAIDERYCAFAVPVQEVK